MTRGTGDLACGLRLPTPPAAKNARAGKLRFPHRTNHIKINAIECGFNFEHLRFHIRETVPIARRPESIAHRRRGSKLNVEPAPWERYAECGWLAAIDVFPRPVAWQALRRMAVSKKGRGPHSQKSRKRKQAQSRHPR